MGWEEAEIEEMTNKIRDFLRVEMKVCRECKESVKGPFD
jgi:hypothetical protein